MAESLLLTKTAQVISGYSPITVFLVASIAIFLVVYNKRRARLVKHIERIPGPAAMPFLGNAIEMNVDHDGESSSRSEFSEILAQSVIDIAPVSDIDPGPRIAKANSRRPGANFWDRAGS